MSKLISLVATALLIALAGCATGTSYVDPAAPSVGTSSAGSAN